MPSSHPSSALPDSHPLEHLASRLLEARKASNLTLLEAASEANMTTGALEALEQAAREPDAAEIIKLAGVYRVSTAELLGQDGAGVTLSEAELAQLLRGMLSHDAPGRGAAFRDFIAGLRGKS